MSSLDDAELTAVTGGMKWQDFRRSTNIEDRRPPEAVTEDDTWMKTASWRNPTQFSPDVLNRQIADQWVRDANARLGR